MKTTLEERLAAAAANMKLTARKAFTHPITSILSLCMVAGIAATIASFSQTSKPAVAVAPAPQVPLIHTITDLNGRKLEGLISRRTATDIAFIRNDGQKFTIKLDTLSQADQDAIAEIAIPDPNVVKRPRVLMVTGYNYYYPDYAEWIAQLKNQGIDVTIGEIVNKHLGGNRLHPWELTIGEIENKHLGDKRLNSLERNRIEEGKDKARACESLKIPPNTEHLIFLNPVTIINGYDIVWMPNFSHYNEYHYDIINQVLKTKGILLISLSKKTEKMAQLKYILSFDEFENDNYDPKKGGMPPENFVKCEDNIVFYNDSVDPPSKPKISKKEVRETITTVMKRLLRSQK